MPDAAALARETADRAARSRPSVVVGVLDGGERVVAGAGDPTPDGHSLFEIGSITKVFTATVLADEVVRGNLTLDQPVRELLPPGTVVPRRGGQDITLGHLATHTSGLPRVPLSGVRPWLEFLRGHDPYVEVTPDALLATLGRTRLRRRPGTGKIDYSNFGFGVLGAALVHTTGARDYEQLVVERVCRPLGMHDTAVHVEPTRLLPGHRRHGGLTDEWLLTGIAGAGALRSSAHDLLTFLAAHLDPGSTPLADALSLTQREQVSGIGLGWMHATKPNLLLWHNGGTGGYRSFAGFLPGRGKAVAVLTPSTRGLDLIALGLLRRLAPVA